MLLQITGNNIEVAPLLMWFTGGLALFMLGIELMSEGMKKASGNGVRRLLARMTGNRFTGTLFGVALSLAIQSASASIALLVSFVQTGMITLSQSLSLILGSNIGTTVTTQLIAFKLTDYAILLVTIGVVLRMFSRKLWAKNAGQIVLGFGLLFFGIKIMSDAIAPLRTQPDIVSWLKHIEQPFAGVGIGFLLTTLIHSISAFVGIVMVLAQQGIISMPAGIALVIGANIGMIPTAWLVTVGAPRSAKQVAFAYSVFKFTGAIIITWFVPYIAQFLQHIGSWAGNEPLRQIANAHTLFNVFLALLFVPFLGVVRLLTNKIIPIKPVKVHKTQLLFIDNNVVHLPEAALHLAQAETARVTRLVADMFENAQTWFVYKTSQQKKLPDVHFDNAEQDVDSLAAQIQDYLVNVSRHGLSQRQTGEMIDMITIVNDLEAIGDVVHRDLLRLHHRMEKQNITFSDEGCADIQLLCRRINRQLEQLEKALRQNKLHKAAWLATSDDYQNEETQLRVRHIVRVQKGVSESEASHNIHIELMDKLKQINLYVAGIAKRLNTFKPDKPDTDPKTKSKKSKK